MTINISSRCALLIALYLVVCLTAISIEQPMDGLKDEADRVLANPDNVARRAAIAPVFRLAEQYVAAGKTNEGLSYYLKGLEHQPWNLDAQLAVARLFWARGDTNSAKVKAELILAYGETDSLLAGAAELLGKPFNPRLSELEPWPDVPFALAIGPYGSAETWLLWELKADLPNLIGIPVVIRPLPLDLPKSGRDPLRSHVEDLRKRIAIGQQDPRFKAQVSKLNLTTNFLSTDDEVFAFVQTILNSETNKELARQFQEELAFLRRVGPQWDSTELAKRVGAASDVMPGSGKAYLAVTPVDLYANENRYVFGVAAIGFNYGVLSYGRFIGATAEVPPSRERLKARALKQALSSIGQMFGVPRCTNPTCGLAYANGLVELDAKQPKLCSQCLETFAKRFGKSATAH